MYESYWHLTRPAFENDSDAGFYFPARSHHGALLKLRYLVENRKELGLLVGDHGLGKSYLTHVLESQLDPAQHPIVRLLLPTLAPTEMLRYLAGRLGVALDELSVQVKQDVILSRLELQLEQMHGAGVRPVLIVDDAHLLDVAHLQMLQLLLNVHQNGPGATLLLVGRAELLPRLRLLPGLADRVSVKTTLKPLSVEECGQYIRHRLTAAGSEAPLLDPQAVRAVWQSSRGLPRKLNQLCDLSLLVGYADGLSSLTRVEVEAAAEELCGVSAD